MLIALVSDGAGSAKQSNVGACLACDHFAERITSHLLGGSDVEQLTHDMIESWLHALQLRLTAIGAEAGLPLRAYACTLLGAIVGEHWSAFLQVGDGAIIVSPRDEPDEFSWVYWPQQGEYENVTYFATDPSAPANLHFDLAPGPIDEVAIFSDGLQRLVLDFRSQSAPSPFFTSMLRPIRSEPVGHSESISSALAQYLDTDPINARTDDDKSLVLATRRAPALTCCDKDVRNGDHGTRPDV